MPADANDPAPATTTLTWHHDGRTVKIGVPTTEWTPELDTLVRDCLHRMEAALAATQTAYDHVLLSERTERAVAFATHLGELATRHGMRMLCGQDSEPAATSDLTEGGDRPCRP